MNLSIGVDNEQVIGISFFIHLGHSEYVNASTTLRSNGNPQNPEYSEVVMPGESLWMIIFGTSCYTSDVGASELITIERIGSETVYVDLETSYYAPTDNDCPTNPSRQNDENEIDREVVYFLLAFGGMSGVFVLIMVLVTPKRSDLMKAKEKNEKETN